MHGPETAGFGVGMGGRGGGREDAERRGNLFYTNTLRTDQTHPASLRLHKRSHFYSGTKMANEKKCNGRAIKTLNPSPHSADVTLECNHLYDAPAQ